jgi:flagellar biosynthetic protein FliP
MIQPTLVNKLFIATALSTVFIVLAGPSFAQDIGLPFGDDGSLTTRTIQLFILITVLSIVPGIAIMVTCFPFIVTVLAILRQAIGLQQSPPNMLMVSLALFLTYFVMEPVFSDAWFAGIQPLLDGEIEAETAFLQTMEPLRAFMLTRIDADTMFRLSELRPDLDPNQGPEQMPLSVLIPSFMLSEMEHAFQVGFLIFLPFLIIDLVVAAVLMSMGMMMVPPAIVSLPFKLAFFVVADGWSLIAVSLVRGYGGG